jgi:hypothetical protein
VKPYVIAVDPGGMCGWAMAHFPEDHFRPEYVAAGQSPADEFMDWAADNIGENCLVIVEKFTITARTAQLSMEGIHMTMDVIGVMRFLSRRAGAEYDNGQTPSAAKRFMNDAQLKKVGLWQPGKDHARDAIRHLLLGIVNHGTGQAREEMIQSLV